MYEAEVMLRYYLGSRRGVGQALAGVVGLMKQAGLAMNMLRKRKLSLMPERIEQPEELKAIVRKGLHPTEPLLGVRGCLSGNAGVARRHPLSLSPLGTWAGTFLPAWRPQDGTGVVS